MSCPVSALCIERGGPEDLGLAKCAQCGAVVIETGVQGLTEVRGWRCHRTHVIFRDFQNRCVPLQRCPLCQRLGTLGWLRFV